LETTVELPTVYRQRGSGFQRAAALKIEIQFHNKKEANADLYSNTLHLANIRRFHLEITDNKHTRDS
jgi:hypothetical protein